MSMLTPENRAKLLTEEKEYWQNKCLNMRHAANLAQGVAEKQAAILADNTQEIDDLRRRLELINKLHHVCALNGAPFTMSHPGNLSVASLEEEIKRASEYRVEKSARTLHMRDFFHVAWYQNGSMYLDIRKLSKEDNARLKGLCKAGEKHKLYIFDPMGGEDA